MQRLRYLSLLLVWVLWIPLAAVAENSTSASGFTVHYNALSTADLMPKVAKTYGIKRSKHRGMLNVSVIDEKTGSTGTSIPADVKAGIKTLTGQKVPIDMRQIKDRGAIYYLGEFSVRNEEKVTFVIEVVPEGTKETFVVNMEQQFFTD